MNRQEALKYINQHPEKHLTRARKKGWLCPLCGNGSGSSGDGLVYYDETHLKCFACDFYGDMVDLIARENRIDIPRKKANESEDETKARKAAYAEAFDLARSVYELEITEESSGFQIQPSADFGTSTNTPVKENGLTEEDIRHNNEVNAYLQESRSHLSETDYLQRRGISREVSEAYGIGYDPDVNAIVLPTVSYKSKGGHPLLSCTRRSVQGDSPNRFSLPKGYSAGVFNFKAMLQSRPVFVTESTIDALSVMEVSDSQAVGINSISNIDSFLRLLETTEKAFKEDGKKMPKPSLVCVFLDNDEKGLPAAGKLLLGLQELGYEAISAVTPKGCKDANELLIADGEALRNLVTKAARGVTEKTEKAIAEHSLRELLPAFNDYVKDGLLNKFIPTGFPQLDNALGGGLLPRLYVLGAVTSLGKTTLALQICDHIASSGCPVLVFSLEMAKEDLIARSISRNTWKLALQTGSRYSGRDAKTELGILSAQRYAHYSAAELSLIQAATEKYLSECGDRLYLYEGKHTVDDVYDTVKKFVDTTGLRPVVLLDYLQFLRPTEKLVRASDKQMIDYAVDRLASLRRELRVPILAISSIGRSEYDSETSIGSMKESGSIEFSADCVIGLDFSIDRKNFEKKLGVNERKDEIKRRIRKAKESVPRAIELTLHKNRGNKAGVRILYNYDPRFNYFQECNVISDN